MFNNLRIRINLTIHRPDFAKPVFVQELCFLDLEFVIRHQHHLDDSNLI